MKVTVTELPNNRQGLSRSWELLVQHVRQNQSNLVLLPEMIFSPWFALSQQVDLSTWQNVVAEHDAWEKRFAELAPAMVVSSRPVDRNRLRQNEGFVWSRAAGYRSAHRKYYLPDEDGFWEATWYQRGDGDFSVTETDKARLAFLICSELWFPERARLYGKVGAQVILNPRASGRASVNKWLACGQTSAVVAGAYVLSANRVSNDDSSPVFGGHSWVVSPDGDLLGMTSRDDPFVTVEIDLSAVEQARQTYPRYIPD